MNQLLDTFFVRRQNLVDTLIEVTQQVNAWYQAHKVGEPTLQDLALLEGLLAERRKHLERLMKLDDDILDHLVAARGQR